MRISLAYNLKRDQTESEAELLSEEDVERLLSGLPLSAQPCTVARGH